MNTFLQAAWQCGQRITRWVETGQALWQPLTPRDASNRDGMRSEVRRSQSAPIIVQYIDAPGESLPASPRRPLSPPPLPRTLCSLPAAADGDAPMRRWAKLPTVDGRAEYVWDDKREHFFALVEGDVAGYNGSLRDGLAHGLGQYYEYDGRCAYFGMWHAGMRHGIGQCRRADGGLECGLFCNDELAIPFPPEEFVRQALAEGVKPSLLDKVKDVRTFV